MILKLDIFSQLLNQSFELSSSIKIEYLLLIFSLKINLISLKMDNHMIYIDFI